MANNSIARGFRFYPTEEELVGFYLRNKLENKRKDMERVIPVLDVYSFEPSQLPQMSGEPCIWDSEQWFFFCPRQMREAHGGRPTRTTASGYWKATGSPAPVYSSSSSSSSRAIAIGVKKTMVFYEGRAPYGTKTKWKMNEYMALRIEQGDTATTAAANQPKLCNDFSLCRVYIKAGCRRAFDRRPPALTSSSGADGVTRSHAAVPTVGQSSSERPVDASHDSSSSGDHGRDGDDDDDWKLIEGMDWDFFDSI